ncbi:hypothetical protein [Nocardia jejuensis]|uniref:hypothetical protein n=1 Tax=Nocardia jejuensis TaxID=328049 RepID=UPI00083179CF|nr:hypothetical protein [Nocardia jejuensis]
MRTQLIVATTVAFVIVGGSNAAALPTGSFGSEPAVPVQPAQQEPTQDTVTIGAYCGSTYAPTRATAKTSTGQTVYCDQVRGTDAFVWWPAEGILPTDPHHSVSAGDYCIGEGDIWGDAQGRKMFCKSINGVPRWQLAR